ncbi:hypothetical protein BE04_09320 [Sorangium cellulosum]|uniref:Uncharacterized protein n=2 Tax=Sorangium cellulosum TaxID=56 RepID=A0A150NZL9_SORCE|nr:hypothetical protein SCE1572_16120 [Sorangium cellulosum So0157-2]KYF47775.1 hypothetical protein BE04_09320 [Sorangium cellulosum]
MTRRLGDTGRRYLRYRRALDGALCDEALRPHLDRLFDGLWFIFTADGRLKPEETALLAAVLRQLPASARAGLNERLADDIAWIEGLRGVPEGARAPLLCALEPGRGRCATGRSARTGWSASRSRRRGHR